MFEKIKLNNFKRKIINISVIEHIKQLYLSAPDYIKNDKELCNIIFEKNSSLLNILPFEFQIEKIHNGNFESLITLASEQVQKEYLKNHISDDVINTYITQFPEVITDFILNDTSLFNDISISKKTKQDLIRLLNSKDLLKTIVNNHDLTNNNELIKFCVDLDNNLLPLISSELRIDYFMSKITSLQGNYYYLDYYKYLTSQEKNDVFNRILLKKGSDITDFEKESLIKNISNEFQKKIALTNFSLLKYCSKEVQLEIINKDNKLVKYLDNNVKKEILNKNPNLVYQLKEIITSYSESFKELQDINVENLNSDDIIKNPIFNAKGSTLLNASANGSYDMLFGINQYTKSQYDFFQRMSDEQIARLCMYDTNYILPVLNVNNNIENLKLRIKNIFKLLYGEEILNKYSSLIDIVIDNYRFDCLNNHNCILDSLKIVFNKDIIKNNDVKLINDYIFSNINENSNHDLFMAILKNAYGDSAADILRSRDKLNEHNINSLEVFNPIIEEKFGIGLVHDLISYNLSNMSYFLSIIKDDKKISQLSDLFEVESNIYGKNISTFQRTLIDFEKVEKILNDIGENELSEVEIENLHSLIINRNFGNITKKEDLINYEQIVKEKLLAVLKEVDDINYIKEKICNALFGINYNENIERIDKVASFYLELYNNSNAYNNDLLTDREKIMLDFLDIIVNENNKEIFIEIINSLFEENNILGNIDFIKATNKIKNNQEKLLNDNLVKIDKLEDEVSKNNGKVIKIINDGVPIYILNGLDFGLLMHNIGGSNNAYIHNAINNGNAIDNIDFFEEQFGSSTISMWYLSNNNEFKEKQNDVLQASLGIGYYSVPTDSIVGMDIGAGVSDISTDHASKLTTSFTKYGNINFDAVNKSNRREEISMYRKIRNQQNVTNENRGGRFDFDYFAGTVYLSDLNNINNLNLYGEGYGLYDEARSRNKPIILINTYAYAKKRTNIQEEIIERGISK